MGEAMQCSLPSGARNSLPVGSLLTFSSSRRPAYGERVWLDRGMSLCGQALLRVGTTINGCPAGIGDSEQALPRRHSLILFN